MSRKGKHVTVFNEAVSTLLPLQLMLSVLSSGNLFRSWVWPDPCVFLCLKKVLNLICLKLFFTHTCFGICFGGSLLHPQQRSIISYGAVKHSACVFRSWCGCQTCNLSLFTPDICESVSLWNHEKLLLDSYYHFNGTLVTFKSCSIELWWLLLLGEGELLNHPWWKLYNSLSSHIFEAVSIVIKMFLGMIASQILLSLLPTQLVTSTCPRWQWVLESLPPKWEIDSILVCWVFHV